MSPDFAGKTIRTARKDVYRELVDEKKAFSRQIDLFLLALAVGFAKDRRSEATPTSDIVKLEALKTDVRRVARDLIEIVSALIPPEENDTESWRAVLAFADAGLEDIWKEFQTTGLVDIPKMLAEADTLAKDRANGLFEALERAGGGD